MSLADRLEEPEPTPRTNARPAVSIVSKADVVARPQLPSGQAIDPELASELFPVAIGASIVVAAIVARAFAAAIGIVVLPGWPAILGIGCLAGVLAYLLFRAATRSVSLRHDPIAPGVATGVMLIAFLFVVLSATLAALQAFDQFGAPFLALWGVTCLILVALLQIIAGLYGRALVAEGRLETRVVLYGRGELLESARTAFEASQGNRIVGIYNDDIRQRPGEPSPGLDEIAELARSGACDRVILAYLPTEASQIRQAADRLSAMPIAVQLWSDAGRLLYPINGVEAHGSVVLFNLQRRPLGPRGLIFKTILDYTIAAAALVLLSPVMALIAIAIKLDSRGPVFFVQPRGGYRHRTISVIKFRTMNVLETGADVKQAERNDPRVTRVGRFLRRTSLDELPQLFNVLHGDLSLVGPRPHALAHDRQYGAIVEQYANRAKIKPGITGWAQVNGSRSQTSDPNLMRERVRYDLYYIEHWSLWLDLRILMLTVRVLFGDRKAY